MTTKAKRKLNEEKIITILKYIINYIKRCLNGTGKCKTVLLFTVVYTPFKRFDSALICNDICLNG